MDPVAELLSSEFYEMRGFWPGQLIEICENLALIPDRIVLLPSMAANKIFAAGKSQ